MRRFPYEGISGGLTRATARCCNPSYQHRLEVEQMESSPAKQDLSMLVGERLDVSPILISSECVLKIHGDRVFSVYCLLIGTTFGDKI